MRKIAATLLILLITSSLYSQDYPAVVYNAREPQIGWSKNIILFSDGQFISVIQQDLGGGYTYGHWKLYDNILELKEYPRIDHAIYITSTTEYDSNIGEQTAIFLDNEYPIVVEHNGIKMRIFPFRGAAHGEFLPFKAEKIWVECGILPHGKQQIKEIELYDSINNRHNNVITIDVDNTYASQHKTQQKYIVLDSCTIYDFSSKTKYIRRDSVSAERYLKQVLTENILNTINEHHRYSSSIITPVAHNMDTTIPNMTRFMLKYENNRSRLDCNTLAKCVTKVFTKQQALNSEDDYILFINYLKEKCHEYYADISRMIYNEFLLNPEKIDLIDCYIRFLPTEDIEATKQELITMLAYEHSKRITTFREEEFLIRFPTINANSRHLSLEICNQGKYAATLPDANRIIEIYEKIDKEMSNSELTAYVRDIFQDIPIWDIPTLTENDYATIVLYWAKNLTEYDDVIGAGLYKILYLYPYIAEHFNIILTKISFKEQEVAKKNFASSITIEHSKRQALFHEDIFYLKFTTMKQYKEIIDPIIEEREKKYLDELKKTFGN